ncbi:ribose transport system substrate-binding protein [Pseudoxanthobacter soli DSM 19599]|uniref:Ribose transport system substrate-binding protein n=1 Tax=Pseudoxanthobacter soli DSM 19599 TaxID=1123029 RepID=A0A1M7ZS22_9HYPH|nr:sugar ABC transporter substrate-binding protein [Pseudoxanthobacter soli]SHO67685.1 ribose transport system substrate-binding protein [Pseudoxanthobacter soli DSM 19599]
MSFLRSHMLAMAGVAFIAGVSGTGPSAYAAEKTVPEAAKTHQMPWGEFKLAPRIVKKIEAGEKVNIIVDIEGTGIPIQGAEMRIGTKKGCDAANKELSAECRLVGPVNPDTTKQLAELETLLNSGQVDCLALQPPLPNQFTGIINKYAAAGIPVFTLNIDAPKAKRFAFYALNEVQAGTINGEATAKLIKEKGIKVDQIAMGSGAPDQPWAQSRMEGFMAGYKSVFPDAKFFNDAKSGIPTGKNFTTQEVLNSVTPFLTAHPDVTLFFHTDQGVEGVGNVIRNLKLNGKVFTSGFNVSGAILDAIADGTTLVTIDQGFDNQAQAPVEQCAKYLATGETPADPLQYLRPIVITKAGGQDELSVEAGRERLKAASH